MSNFFAKLGMICLIAAAMTAVSPVGVRADTAPVAPEAKSECKANTQEIMLGLKDGVKNEIFRGGVAESLKKLVNAAAEHYGHPEAVIPPDATGMVIYLTLEGNDKSMLLVTGNDDENCIVFVQQYPAGILNEIVIEAQRDNV